MAKPASNQPFSDATSPTLSPSELQLLPNSARDNNDWSLAGVLVHTNGFLLDLDSADDGEHLAQVASILLKERC